MVQTKIGSIWYFSQQFILRPFFVRWQKVNFSNTNLNDDFELWYNKKITDWSISHTSFAMNITYEFEFHFHSTLLDYKHLNCMIFYTKKGFSEPKSCFCIACWIPLDISRALGGKLYLSKTYGYCYGKQYQLWQPIQKRDCSKLNVQHLWLDRVTKVVSYI